MVIVAAVLSCGQNGGCSTLKALHGQCALTRSHVDFGKVQRTKLHPPDKVSCSVLCTETQMQAYHSAVISNTLRHECVALKQYESPARKTDATLTNTFNLL